MERTQTLPKTATQKTRLRNYKFAFPLPIVISLAFAILFFGRVLGYILDQTQDDKNQSTSRPLEFPPAAQSSNEEIESWKDESGKEICYMKTLTTVAGSGLAKET